MSLTRTRRSLDTGRIIEWFGFERTLKIIVFQTPAMDRCNFHYTRWLKAPSSLALSISRDGVGTTSLQVPFSLKIGAESFVSLLWGNVSPISGVLKVRFGFLFTSPFFSRDCPISPLGGCPDTTHLSWNWDFLGLHSGSAAPLPVSSRDEQGEASHWSVWRWKAVLCCLQVVLILLAGFQALSSPNSNPLSHERQCSAFQCILLWSLLSSEISKLKFWAQKLDWMGMSVWKNTIRFCLVLPFTFAILCSCLQLRIGFSFFLHAGNAIKN